MVSPRRSTLNVFQSPEPRPLKMSLDLGEQKEVRWCHIRAVRRLWQRCPRLFCQLFGDEQAGVRRCIVVMENPRIGNLRTDSVNPGG
ncbi:hypothetical protein J6590_020551 [Homalodisca vitripennis]|nr:hypothetical protein J6590_020551 [Homalodisca vitripennis]